MEILMSCEHVLTPQLAWCDYLVQLDIAARHDRLCHHTSSHMMTSTIPASLEPMTITLGFVITRRGRSRDVAATARSGAGRAEEN